MLLAKLILLLAVASQLVLEHYGDRALDFWWAASLHGVATVAFLVVVWGLLREKYRPSLLVALGFAVVLRLLVLPLEPALSDDVYRYMHEGNLVLEGVNPYVVSPENTSEELRHPEYYGKINNREIPAAYPPAVQYSLALGVLIEPTPLGQKLVFGGLDLLVFLALWFWLPVLGLPSTRAVIYGYCPLMALEFAGEGHSDSLTALFLVLCLWSCGRGLRHLGGVYLALATAGKLIPIVLLPFLWRQAKWYWLPLLCLPFCLVLGFLYFRFLDPDMLEGTLAYAENWRSNDSLFHLLHAASNSTLQWLNEVLGRELHLSYFPHRVAKVPVGILGCGLLIWAWLRRWPLHKTAAAFFMFFVSFTPTLHPWYLVLLLPFLCIYPNWGWLLFTGTVYLSYHVLPLWKDKGEWVEDLLIKIAEYVPFYFGFVLVLRDRRKASKEEAGSEAQAEAAPSE